MSTGLKREIANCQLCAQHLPLGPRPIVRFSAMSRLLIVGQAPGSKVHASGISWDDDSGDRLRSWLGLDKQVFYDEARVALVPMGFCYPGRRAGGDAPPRPECAPLWHGRVLSALPADRLTILAGIHAQHCYLPAARRLSMTERVQRFREFLPQFFPLPHPAWRSRIWMQKNPWFENEVLPVLREEVRRALN